MVIGHLVPTHASRVEDAPLAGPAGVIIITNHHRAPKRYWVRPSASAKLDRYIYRGSTLFNDLNQNDRVWISFGSQINL